MTIRRKTSNTMTSRRKTSNTMTNRRKTSNTMTYRADVLRFNSAVDLFPKDIPF
jgi:hypothetical protein